MSSVAISIVVPYHNREFTLNRCLRSLVSQTLLPQQIVLVDNASIDNSHQVVEAFIAQCDTTIEWLHITETQKGASIARNTGLANVTTPYVAFFDSDDEMSPTFIADATQMLSKQPCDLVIASTMMQWPDGSQHIRPLPRPLTLNKHLVYSSINTQCFVVRTSFLKAVGGWNASLAFWNDYELGIRLLMANPTLSYLKQTYHTIYQHEDSITEQSKKARLKDYYSLFATIEKRLRNEENMISRSNAFALAVKVSHWQGYMRRNGRDIAEFSPLVNWYHQLLRSLSWWQRCCCHTIRWGTQRGIRGLLHLYEIFRVFTNDTKNYK